MKRIVAAIPNLLTCCNLLAGCVAVAFAFKGEYLATFIAVMVASGFDFLDGFSARMLGAYSDIGKELDSLSDIVSFGLVPGALLHFRYAEAVHRFALCQGTPSASIFTVLSFVPFIITAASGLRLAKFNIDQRQHHSFLGLSTPPCALLVSSMLTASQHGEGLASPLLDTIWGIPAISAFLSLLLVSEIPMFSFKITSFSLKENKERIIFLCCALLFIVFGIVISLHWSAVIFLIALFYVLQNIFTPSKFKVVE